MFKYFVQLIITDRRLLVITAESQRTIFTGHTHNIDNIDNTRRYRQLIGTQ